MCILCCYWPKISKCPHLSAEQVKLRESNDKLEREGIEMANELPQDPEGSEGRSDFHITRYKKLPNFKIKQQG